MKTKALLIVTFLCLAVQDGFSQRIFQGKIVTTENDTLRGEVWFGLSGKMPPKTKLVYFSADGQKTDRFKARELASMSLVHDLTLEEYRYERLDTANTIYLFSRARVSAGVLFQKGRGFRKYKGFFAGINVSSSTQTGGVHLGWHLGYAVRGDLQKKVVPQLELLLSSEGFKTNVENIHVVLVYTKLPLLLNVRPRYSDNPVRMVFGLQPTLYMGGYAKRGERLYNPSHIFDNKVYVQPGIERRRGPDGKLMPRPWNLEGVIGFEALGKKRMNFGMRLNIGFFGNNRFQNAGLSIRLGV
ncbi:MAG TPA: hypothetical protein ENJ95_11235 [Bacteroidetes bacterium]|nr:hypothetical protein [Bacteroidota bacterium]